MQVLTTILYILLFLVFLSILIIIHELGHLAAAKAFNVYCLEYSIGMGPLLFKHKRKNGETQFSLRGIPFGGYVSMYGEGVPLPEGVTVDESRSLNNIKPWKRAIVLSAGVIMNAVLALVFFFASNCFVQERMDYVNHLNIAESVTGLADGDFVKFEPIIYTNPLNKKETLFYFADNETTFNNDDSVKYATCFNFDTLKSFKHLGLEEYICFYKLKNEPVSLYKKTTYTSEEIFISNDYYQAERSFKLLKDNGIITSYSVEKFNAKELDYEPKTVTITSIDDSKLIDKVNDGAAAIMPSNYASKDWDASMALMSQDNYVPDFAEFVSPTFDTATIHLRKRVEGSKGGLVDDQLVALQISQNEGQVQSFGCSIFYQRFHYNFGQIVKHTFTDFGESSLMLFKAIGGLFTSASAWQNIGGIVAVGFETTNVLQNFGFGKFLYYWGFISINLAIFNLFPFPGLDGWQLLVLGVETGTRKKIPEKVKNIVSMVGIALLLSLMLVVVFKDLFKYVFVRMLFL